jgi:hypothetical protein
MKEIKLRKIEEMIAKEIMDWTDQGNGKWKMNKIGEGTLIGYLPLFTEQAPAADEVVVAMANKGVSLTIKTVETDTDGAKGLVWEAGFGTAPKVQAVTKELAICLAALGASGFDTDDLI